MWHFHCSTAPSDDEVPPTKTGRDTSVARGLGNTPTSTGHPHRVPDQHRVPKGPRPTARRPDATLEPRRARLVHRTRTTPLRALTAGNVSAAPCRASAAPVLGLEVGDMTDDVNAAETDAHVNELPAPSGNPSAPTVATLEATGRSRSRSGSCSSPASLRSAPARSTPAPPACTPTTSRSPACSSPVAVAQIAVGLFALVKGGTTRRVARRRGQRRRGRGVGVTRLWGISWIDGLEDSEPPQFTDTVCAALGAIAAVAALAAADRPAHGGDSRSASACRRVRSESFVARRDAARARPTTMPTARPPTRTTRPRPCRPTRRCAARRGRTEGDAAHSPPTDDGTSTRPTPATRLEIAARGLAAGVATRPADRRVGRRRRDPPSSSCGRPRCSRTRRRTCPASPTCARSARSASSRSATPVDRLRALHQLLLHRRRHFLDPTIRSRSCTASNGDRPHARVGDVHRRRGRHRRPRARRLRRPADAVARAPRPLLDRRFADGPQVAGSSTPTATARRVRSTPAASNPMVHVWIVPHPCGPFAALEGHGAGDRRRRDSAPTSARHEPRITATDGMRRPRTEPRPSGTSSPVALPPARRRLPLRSRRPVDADRPLRHARRDAEQQAFAENLVADTLSQPAAVVRPGGRRGGRVPLDRRRRHRARALHPVGLDQRRRLPRPRPARRASCTSRSPTARAGSCRRCTCCPTSCTLDDVPDWGGALMQWHIHDNLCFDAAIPTRRASAASPTPGRLCTAPLVQARRGPDDPRLDHAPPVRTVRRPRGHRCRPDRRRRRAALRPRPRHRAADPSRERGGQSWNERNPARRRPRSRNQTSALVTL